MARYFPYFCFAAIFIFSSCDSEEKKELVKQQEIDRHIKEREQIVVEKEKQFVDDSIRLTKESYMEWLKNDTDSAKKVRVIKAAYLDSLKQNHHSIYDSIHVAVTDSLIQESKRMLEVFQKEFNEKTDRAKGDFKK